MFGEKDFNNIKVHQKIEKEESDPILQELIEKIKEMQKQENFIGEGATAKVFASQTNPDVCYKIIHGSGDYNFRNTVTEEAEILEIAEKISRSCGVKIPKPYYSIMENGKIEVLVMERMHAVSIREILEGNLEIDDSFDFKKFTEKVEQYFLKLNEHNVYHRDAHWGNIMIEFGTNEPCIIDFGASIELRLRSEDPYKQADFSGNTITFTPDNYKIRDELRVKLRTYLFKKYGNIHNL
ncbi:MAG: hypothetical protein ACD_5C00277G0001 [uncultured bacterium]|nr:MAG: hypothetical protein ACD_5C00277G0001 [uncultured bacterium]